MKKFDKEYFTQWNEEKAFLERNNIFPTFVKVVNGVTTYKYAKTNKLFETLCKLYKNNTM